jgi:RNA polymerase sigma-70 factor (ECF subfamily)
MKENPPILDSQLSNPERWVDQHAEYLYRYALLRLQDRELAEDIVQETFLAALQARDKFEGRSSERTWLIGILKHKIIDYFRKACRENPLDYTELLTYKQEDAFEGTGKWVGHWKEELGPIAWASDPNTVLEQREFWEIFNSCLSALPSRLAQVFMLREMEGLSTEEICQILNISAANLSVMLHRARMKLRHSLEVKYFRPKSKK